MFRPKADWRPPSMAKLPVWVGYKRIGIDTETRDELIQVLGPGVRRGAYVVGISFAIEDVGKWYLPIRHEGGDNLDAAQVLRYLKEQAASYTGSICGANLSYDLDMLTEIGIEFPHANFLDIQVAEPLIDENQFHYSLEAIAQKYGFLGKNEELLRDAASAYHVHPKGGLWKLPARYVGPYAEDDADLPLRILRKQERIIDAEDLWDIYRLESKVLPVLLKMRRRGVRIDLQHLDRVEAWSYPAEQKMLDVIHARSGIRIGINEINLKTLLARVLDNAGIKYPLTPANHEPQINAELLSKHASDPAVSAILHAKYINKLRNTFVNSIRQHQVKGRIHPTFNQLRRQEEQGDDVKGAGPGRLSSCDPNIQQQPGRNPGWWDSTLFEGMGMTVPVHKFWRQVYVPDEGGRWCCCDLSGQEPRMFVHFAHAAGCKGAEEAMIQIRDHGADFHDVTTSLAFGITRESVGDKAFDKKRKTAKILFLGIVYGMGGAKLCHTLGYPTRWINIRGERREIAGEEGQAFLEEFHKKVPFLGEIKKKVEAVAWNRRWIRTIAGRHIHYVQGTGNERKALNNLIQGCVRGDSYILEKQRGLSRIDSLPQKVTVWDGNNWSPAYCLPSGLKKEMEICFKNGQVLYTSTDHMFRRVNTLGAEFWTPVRELKPGDFVRRNTKSPIFGKTVPLPAPDILTHWKAPNGPANAHRYSWDDVEDDYHRGLLLGRIASDGCFSGTTVDILIASHEEHIGPALLNVPFVRHASPVRRSVVHHNISSISLVRQCRMLDIKNKIHPYIMSSKEILRGYLRGMFDGDGGVSIGKASGITYSTIHLCFGKRHNHTNLPRDVQTALTAFGISSRLHKYSTSVRLKIVDKDNARFLEEIGFINHKKTNKVLQKPAKVRAIGEVEKIVSTNPTGREVPMYDIINSETQQFTVDGLVTHNSSADQTKLALVDLDAAGLPIQLQVHDEVDLTIYNDSEAKQVADIMVHCLEISTGSKVDIEVGPTWGDSMGNKLAITE